MLDHIQPLGKVIKYPTKKTMVPRIKSFNNTHPRGFAGEGNSTAPHNNSIIVKKVLSTATGEIFFLPKKTPLVMF